MQTEHDRTADVMAKATGGKAYMPPGPSETAPIPSGHRSDPGNPTEPYDVADPNTIDRLTERDSWHLIHTPKTVNEAWAKVDAAIDKIYQYSDRWEDLDAQERNGKGAPKALAYNAMKDGKAPPAKAAIVDNTDAKRAALAAMSAAVLLTSEARSEYARVVRRELPSWRKSILADYARLQPAAKAAWNEFRAAREQWGSFSTALREINAAMGHPVQPSFPGWVTDQHATAAAGTQAIEAILGSTNPLLTGSWVTEPLNVKPPLWRRREMAQDHRWHHELREIEQKERNSGRTITTHLIP